jgi:hypothetical protein
MGEGSRITGNSFRSNRRYLASTRTDPMVELILLAAVIGLLALVWLGVDSDDDNGGGGLMQPVLVPVRSARQPGR